MAVVKFAQSGQGGGRNVVAYLVEKERVQGAEVLRGTPQITEALIDSSPHAYTYDHAIVSFSEADSQKLSVRDLEAIMGDFESFAFAGLARDQVDVLWVRHRD